MEQISNNRIIKLGVVVDNLEEAFQYYVELFKLDPTKMRAPKPKPTDSELSQAPVAAATPEGGNTPFVWYRGNIGMHDAGRLLFRWSRFIWN